ncbi:transposon TX1 uncharacterized 149 kDa protein [Elysia marginata]|uniref:Transposon TX1 uncharacterized 149 kDa protein n=1 Tax=Elysia marginata TaxID=1093978 RepID=A0AAV4EK08_9GAST|nr:transposon TX1 uncharacterized 149 kDa protein [Elysia marginata]
MRWASKPPCKNKSATETLKRRTLSQQALDGTPATRADMPSMKVKGQTRKEAFDPTPSMISQRHQMKKGPITCLETEEVIAKSKSNRARGGDRITTDMLKADPSMGAKCLIGLFNRVWTEKKVPDAWRKGILFKLPEKGDLSQCDNWQRINLLSVPGKILCQVILSSILKRLLTACIIKLYGKYSKNMEFRRKLSTSCLTCMPTASAA